MKKLAVLGLIILASMSLHAQDSANHTHALAIGTISCGAMITIGGTAGLPVQEKPFDIWYNLAPSLNFFTGKSHHHVMYGVGNNTIQTLHGYFLPKSWDMYVFYAQNLNSISKKYLSMGIEKVIPAGDHAKFVFFGEMGTNLLGKQSVSLGVVIHPQMRVWQRK